VRAGVDVVRLVRTGKGPMDGWIARAYDRGVQDAFRDVLPEIARDLLPEFRGARQMLDVGCGPGQVTLFLAESLPGTEVTGVDIAPTMIELARGHAARSPAASRVRFEVADVAHLPFADATFDVVASTGSIKHWPDQAAALREIHRVLAPGGRVLLAEMNRLAPPAAIEKQRTRLRHWLFRRIYPRVFEKGLSPAEARALLTASPFGEPTRERALLDGCLWAFEASRRSKPAMTTEATT
jgi:ubiquinone/menaquinone biosynthesis C-methylase UbiE